MGLLRRVFGGKQTSSTTSPPSKRRWSFGRSSSPSSKKHESWGSIYDENLDGNKHAIAVAAATAAVAEAALAAAQAAAEVVRLTTSKPANTRSFAALKIQSAFRAYLARRALRALKALVKLQALVRGHIVRKQTADMLRRMQTLVRLQVRARATRSHSQLSDSCQSSTSSNYSRRVAPSSPHKNHQYRAYSTKYDGPSVLKRCGSNANYREMIEVDGAKFGSLWLERWMEENTSNNHRSKPPSNRHADERNDKILQVDTWKPHHGCASSQRFMPFDSPSKLSTEGPKPEPGSSRGRRAHFTPTRSECSWGYMNGNEDFPNYMSNTESSRAKVRSQSAPRHRLEFDKFGLSKRSLQGLCEGDNVSERSFPHHNDYMHKAYPASGGLSRIGSSNLR